MKRVTDQLEWGKPINDLVERGLELALAERETAPESRSAVKEVTLRLTMEEYLAFDAARSRCGTKFQHVLYAAMERFIAENDKSEPHSSNRLRPSGQSTEAPSHLYTKAQLAVVMLQDVLEEWRDVQKGSNTVSPHGRTAGNARNPTDGDQEHRRRDRKAQEG